MHITTEDGSVGQRGFVTEALETYLRQSAKDNPPVFYNCGPHRMIERATDIEAAYAPRDQIYNSIDFVTKCGVGICGSCATPDGLRACVDGPFLAE